MYFNPGDAGTNCNYGNRGTPVIIDLPFTEIVRALLSPVESVSHQIVWQLRLPRVLAAFACGGLLALAGALLQILLRNPLADPYILGVSGGAGVGALVAMLLGWGLILTNLTSLAGALAAIAIVFGLSFRAGDWNLYRLRWREERHDVPRALFIPDPRVGNDNRERHAPRRLPLD